jgi:hypothetical protein
MSIPPAFRLLRSACAVFFGPHGSVAAQARHQGCSRQSLYRQADHALRSLDPSTGQAPLISLEQQLAQTQERLRHTEQRLRQAIEVPPDKQAEFAATAQALGVSLSQAHALLAVLLGPAAPSVATLGRLAQDASHHAGAVLEVLDAASRARARQIAADEIFSGRRPILMTLEQHSLCWLGGRLADNRDGDTWAKELAPLTAAEQVTADGGQGMRRGLREVNRQRRWAGQPEVRSQRDHFHALQYARRGVRHARFQAAQALKPAERLQKAYDQDGRAGVPRSPAQGLQLHRAWAKAEQAFDRWSAQEQAFQRLRQGLRLFSPEGELNTPERAEAEVRAALAGQTGREWTRARRLLGPEAFTFLERVQEQLAALPVAAALRAAAVRVEGLRRRPQALAGEGPSAPVLRGVLLAANLVLARAGEAGQQAWALVREVLAGAWRASSLVEGLNSVLRMQQRRQKRLTQGLLDLKRLYWNTHRFRAGKRKGSSPYGRLGVVLPKVGWWELLHRSPEQLRRELTDPNPGARESEKQQELSVPKDAA